MAPLRVEAIQATRAPISTGNLRDLVAAELGQSGFAGGMVRRMADYPQQQPTRYVRTGTLGRNWKIGRRQNNARFILVEVINRTPYAVHVEGPKSGPKGKRQTAVMAAKDWPNVTDAAQAEWAIWRPRVVRILVQDDTRLRADSL